VVRFFIHLSNLPLLEPTRKEQVKNEQIEKINRQFAL
jgi:hypothetical protein